MNQDDAKEKVKLDLEILGRYINDHKFIAKLSQTGSWCIFANKFHVNLIHGRTKKLAREDSLVAQLLCCRAEDDEMNNQTSPLHRLYKIYALPFMCALSGPTLSDNQFV